MYTPPLESLFRVFRRPDQDALAPPAAVTRVTGAARVADDARGAVSPWPLERAHPSGNERNEPAPARADPRTPAHASAADAPALRTAMPALLTATSRVTADGFAQGARETQSPSVPASGARNPGAAPVSARERDDEPAALPAARARASLGTPPRAPDAYQAPRDATPRISVSGQLVSELMPEPARASSGGTVQAPEPLLTGPPTHPEKLAQALQASIAGSGLFYESHLAAWTLQRGTLESLAREPQAQWWAAASASAAFTMTPAASDGAALPPALDNVVALRHLRMQLETLESGRVQWQGELWPRQPARLAIEAEGWSCGSPDPVAAVWRSRLMLELPHLGVVDAELVLTGTSLAVRIRPESRLAEAKLRAARDEIASALAARFAASTVTVSHAQAE